MNSGLVIIFGVFLLLVTVLALIFIYLNRKIDKNFPKAIKDPIWPILGSVLLGTVVLVKQFEIPKLISGYVIILPVLVLIALLTTKTLIQRITYSSAVLSGGGLLYYLSVNEFISISTSVIVVLVVFISQLIIMFKYRYVK